MFLVASLLINNNNNCQREGAWGYKSIYINHWWLWMLSSNWNDRSHVQVSFSSSAPGDRKCFGFTTAINIFADWHECTFLRPSYCHASLSNVYCTQLALLLPIVLFIIIIVFSKGSFAQTTLGYQISNYINAHFARCRQTNLGLMICVKESDTFVSVQ